MAKEPINSSLKNSIWAKKALFRLHLRHRHKKSSTALFKAVSGLFAPIPRFARKIAFLTPKRVFQETVSWSATLFVLWLVSLTLIPFMFIFGMSLFTKGHTQPIEWILTMENYVRCAQWIYARVFAKTVQLAFVATSICLVLGFPVAYFLARAQHTWKTVGLILLFVPFWTNFILRVYGLISLFGSHGPINQALLRFGILDEPLQILYSRVGVMIGLVYNYLPYLVVPVYSALEKLDPVFREAAFDLGANRYQSFWKIVVPNVRQSIWVGCLFVFVPVMGEYVIPDLMGGAKESYLGNVMVSQFFTMQDWPFGSAIAAILSSILLFALILRGRREDWVKTR